MNKYIKIFPTLTQYVDNSLFLKLSPLNKNIILIYDIKTGLNKTSFLTQSDPRTKFFNKFKKNR